MYHSCILLNSAALPDGLPPVTALNSAFVTCLSIGREMSRLAENTNPDVSAPLVSVRNLNDSEMREFFKGEQSSSLTVHAYPIQGIHSYQAYESELKETPFEEVSLLAVAALDEKEPHVRVAVNSRYATDEFTSLVEEAATLGIAMGSIHPDNCFGGNLFDADGNHYKYLTCIPHIFKRSKSKKAGQINKMIEAANGNPDVTLIHGVEFVEDRPRILAFWSPLDFYNETKVNNNTTNADEFADVTSYRMELREKYGKNF